MSQHLSEHELEKYVKRTLSIDELLTFDAHMSECNPCSNDLAGRSSAMIELSDIFRDDQDDHLTYNQIENYVDGKSDAVDREIADVHRHVCDYCSRSLEEMIHLRSTLEIEIDPAKSLAASSRTSSYSSFWNKIVTGSFLRFAAPAFGAALLGVIIWFAWFSPNSPPVDVAEVVDTGANTSNDLNIAEITDSNSVVADQTDSNSTLSQPVISLADGGTRIEIDSAGNLTGIDSPQFASRIRSALTTQTIEIAAAAKEMKSRSGVLMGDGQPGTPFALTSPVGEIVRSDRPQFQWRPLKDADSYVVTIYDTNFNKIAESPALRKPAWTASIRLKRGVVYGWQVTAVKDGQEIKSPVRPAPDARFKVLDRAAANDIDTAKRTHGNSHLLLGIVYANAGLLDEAEREFQALVRQNPKSDVARRLLQKVRAAR